MNLTYDDQSFNTRRNEFAHGHVAMAYSVAKKVAVSSGMTKSQFDGFFSSLVNSVKTTLVAPLKATNDLILHGTNAAKADLSAGQAALKKEIVGVSSVVAPVVSVFGPVGMAIGAGLKLGAAKLSADQAKASSINAAVGNDMAVANAYKNIAGSVPGRNIGTSTLQSVMGSFVRAGGYPPLKFDREPDSPASDQTIAWAAQAAQQGIARGATSAQDIYNNEFLSLVASNPNAVKWMNGTFVQPGNAQYQLFIDFIDAAAASINPSFPYSYGVTQSDYAQSSTPTPASPSMSTPALPPSSLPMTIASPTPTMSPAPAAQALTQAGVNPATSDQVNQMLAAMQQQGANNQQMMAAALQALQSSGVNTATPQVQQAAAADVAQMQTAGISSMPSWALPVAAAAVILFALAGPMGKSKPNRAAFESRRKNPRRRKYRR